MLRTPVARPLVTLFPLLILASVAHAQPCVDYTERLRLVLDDRDFPATYSLASAGSLLYLGLEDEIRILDASDPLDPIQIGAVPVSGLVKRIVLGEDRAYVLDTSRLILFDLTDPSAPSPVGDVVVPEDPRDVAADGDYAFVAAGAGGFHVVDISTPSSPAIVLTEAGVMEYDRVRLVGDTAIVTGWYPTWIVRPGSIWIFDVSDPLNPQRTEERLGAGLRVLSIDATEGASRVLLGVRNDVGGQAETWVAAWDFSDPTTPSEVGREDVFGDPLHLHCVGELAYVGAFQDWRWDHSGIHIVDFADVAHPITTGVATNNARSVTGIAVLPGHIVLVGDNGGGNRGTYQVLELLPAVVPMAVSTAGVVIGEHGGNLYLSRNGALEILDATLPDLPVRSSLPIGDALSIAFRGTTACIGAGQYLEGRLDLVDVSDPSAPLALGSLSLSGAVLDLAVTGSHVLLAEYTDNSFDYSFSEVRVVDVADPTDPQTVATVSTSMAYAVRLYDEYAFVADGQSLIVLDVTDLSAPVVVASLPTSELFHDLEIAEEWLIAGGWWFAPSIDVISISNPTDPQPLGSVQLPGRPYDLALYDETVYAVTPEAGLQVVNVSDPASPRVLGGFSAAEFTGSVAVGPGGVYVGGVRQGSLAGILTLPVQCAAATSGTEVHTDPMQLAAFPNPFRAATSVTFALARPAWVDLVVYDVTGRRVARLLGRATSTGTYRVRWEGRTDQGDPVPSGVYYVRLKTADTVRSSKVVRFR